MTAEAIRKHMEAAPYLPVILITVSGERHLVPHPDFLIFSPTEPACDVYAEDGEHFTPLDFEAISAIVPGKRTYLA